MRLQFSISTLFVLTAIVALWTFLMVLANHSTGYPDKYQGAVTTFCFGRNDGNDATAVSKET
jgi:hypothetical protein